MRKILQSKAGVTVLEGVIALGLLALVTAGSFGVLLASSRQSSPSDMREEMTSAVEQADHLLQAYAAWFPNLQTAMDVYSSEADAAIAKVDALKAKSGPYFRSSRFMTDKGPCNAEESAGTVLALGAHSNALNCLLPFICDKNNSSFSYTVENADNIPTGKATGNISAYRINYQISCNGYQL